MPELSRSEQLVIAIDFLEYLENSGGVERMSAYTSADLRRIQRLWRGERER